MPISRPTFWPSCPTRVAGLPSLITRKRGIGARIFPYAEEQQDRFNLRVASFGSFAAAAHVREIWRGSYRSDRLHDFLVDRIAIECERESPLQIGGDVIGLRSIVRAQLSDRPVRVVDYYAPPPV